MHHQHGNWWNDSMPISLSTSSMCLISTVIYWFITCHLQAINQVQDYQDNPHDQECQDNPHDQEDLDHISYDWSVHDESADLGQEHQITDYNGNVIMRSREIRRRRFPIRYQWNELVPGWISDWSEFVINYISNLIIRAEGMISGIKSVCDISSTVPNNHRWFHINRNNQRKRISWISFS